MRSGELQRRILMLLHADKLFLRIRVIIYTCTPARLYQHAWMNILSVMRARVGLLRACELFS